MMKIMATLSVVPKDKMLVCVLIATGQYEVAGIIFDAAERDRFADPTDTRIRQWLLVPKAEILRQKPQLADYVEGRRDWRE